MLFSIVARIIGALTVTRRFTDPLLDGANVEVHNKLNSDETVELEDGEVSSFEVTLVDGAGSITLLDLIGADNRSLNAVDRKVYAVKFAAPDTNVAIITAQDGASNGYSLFGAGWQIGLPPGAEIQAKLAGGAPVAASDAKNIDFVGTGTDKLKVELLFDEEEVG